MSFFPLKRGVGATYLPRRWPLKPRETAVGKYLAFTIEETLGSRHLRALAKAGVSHVQLLPTYDFGTVPEVNATEPSIPVAAPDSELQQAAIARHADEDSYNWGYDPVLYQVPEGSYATEALGGVRVKEFREMVAALHKRHLKGLRKAMS